MTHLSGVIGPSGPVIDVAIGVSAPRQQALVQAKQPVPQIQMARLLIDTGASHTCVDKKILQRLSINPTGQISMHTPSTAGSAVPASTYDVLILFTPPKASMPPDFKAFPVHSVTECDFSGQGIDGLIGRDVLSQSRLIYSGADNVFFLSF